MASPLSTEKYAQHWCSQLTNANGSFAQCHATVNPGTYYSVMPLPPCSSGQSPITRLCGHLHGGLGGC
jgi:mucin-5B